MNKNFNEKIYSKIMPTGKSDEARIGFIANNIKDAELKILDIGCWDGTHSIRFSKKTNKVYGVDISKTASIRAREKGIIVKNGDFMVDDLFKNIRFDIVVAGEIIEHVFDTDLFIQKIFNLLKPGGKLILTTPNIASLPRRILLMLGKNPIMDNRAIGVLAVGHIRYFTFDGIYEILRDNGFRVLKSSSDVLNFNNKGNLYSTLIPKIYKRFGRSIMVVAEKN